MAFDLKFCPVETCDGIDFKDIVGFFSVSRPDGYNAPVSGWPTLDVDGTFGFTSYTLEVWRGKEGGPDEVNDAPDLTFDLLDLPHTVDPVTGFVTWQISLEQLGVEFVRSGPWVFRGTAVNGSSTIVTTRVATFKKDLKKRIDPLMLKRDFSCGCKHGCEDIIDVFVLFFFMQGQVCCSGRDIVQTNVDWLYYHVQKCCP